jgi:hypothetical protein
MSTTLGVHIGWNANLPDQYVQYSDVSGYVTSVDTQRGRSTELDDIQTGTATIALDNSDGRFTPGRAYGKELLPDNVRSSTGWNQNTTGFTVGTYTGISSVSSPTLSWSNSLQAIVSTALAGNRIVRTTAVPVTPGKQYRGSVMASASAGTLQAQTAIRFYDVNGTDLGNGTDFDTTWKQYADVVRASMPVAYHRMNDAGGNSCAPTAGRDPMVTYNVAAGAAGSSWAAGGTASAGVFNGTSSIAEACGIPLATVIDNGSSGGTSSVELWFNTTTPGGLLADAPSALSTNYSSPSQYTISSAGAPVGGGVLFPVAYIGTDGYLYCQQSGYMPTPPKSAYPVNDGLWHHLVIAGGTCYLDGVQFGTGTVALSRPVLGYVDFSASAPSPAKPSTGYFAGSMADVALYRHALTAQAVADHYRHGVDALRPVRSSGSTYPLPWGLLATSVTAPANAFTASVEVVTGNAGTFYFDSFSLRQVSPFYGRIRPRRRVRVFATTGQNLMPPGLNLGYQTYSAIPTGVDANETGAFVLAGGTNFGFDPSSGVATYSANSSSVAALSLYGPSGNGLSVPWMLLPGNTYTFSAQVAAWRFAAASTGVTIGINTTVNSQPGSSTYFNGSVTPQHINPGDVSWKTVSWTFTIPSTYTQPEFLFTFYTSETVSSGTTFGWQTAFRNLQLVDVTNGQTIPAYQAGDATMPVFIGVADKWESTTEYDESATVQLSCSDMMRALGESQMTDAPQSLGFRPDWNCLGAWSLSQTVDLIGDVANVAPNQLLGTALIYSANTAAVSNMFISENPNTSLPGRYLPSGNGGINFNTALAHYLLSFGKLPAKGAVEFWFRPYNSSGTPDVWNGGDNLMCASGPFLSMYIGTGGVGQVSCGWNGRKATSTNTAPGSPANEMTRGGHVAIEVITSGGASPTASVQVFYDGISVVSSSGEAFGPVAQQYNGHYSGFSIGGDRNFTDPITSVSLPQFCGEVYSPAMYGNAGLDWATRVNLFSVSVGFAVNTPVNNGSVISVAQTQLPWIAAASGVTQPIAVGSPAGFSSDADVPIFNSGTGLDAFKAQAAQTMGMVVFNRYGALSIQDNTFRQNGNSLTLFDCKGSNGPDSAMLYVNDIDRTWTSVQLNADSGSTVWNSFAGWSQYGWHQQAQGVQGVTAATGTYAWGFLANYLQPTARIDSASFTVTNNALAASALMVDIGSHVGFSNLPDNAPGDGPYGAYYCWVESVKVSAKAEGGVIVPTVQVTLSPDFTYVPIM